MLVEAWISWPARSNGSASVARILSARATTSAACAGLRLHEHELVATQPGQGVGGADRGADPLGDGAQQPVAGGMAQRVVDVLEAVEVEQQHRDHAALAAGAGQLLAEPVVQQGAVGQAGEQIVQGQTPDHLCAERERSITDRTQVQQIESDRSAWRTSQGRRKVSELFNLKATKTSLSQPKRS